MPNLYSTKLLPIILSTTSACAQSFSGTVIADRYDTDCGACIGNACIGSSTHTLFDQTTDLSGSNLNLSNGTGISTCTYQVRIATLQSTVVPKIARISIDGGSSCESDMFQIIVSNLDFCVINSSFPPPPVPSDWEGIGNLNTTASETVLYGSVLGDLTGSINVTRIAYFECLGEVDARITALDGFDGFGANIALGGTTEDGELVIGNLRELTVAGDLLADATFDSVSFGVTVGGNQGLGRINLTGPMTGDIDFGGQIKSINASYPNGSLEGDIFAEEMGVFDDDETVFAVNDFEGSIFVDEDVFSFIVFVNEWTGTDEVISIGDTLHRRPNPALGNRMIKFFDNMPGNGSLTNTFDHQIIINSKLNNPTSDANKDGQVDYGDFWLGAVSVGFPGGGSNLPTNKYEPVDDEYLFGPTIPGSGYTYPDATRAPYYETLSHEFGGGAIGVAPFNFHQFQGPAPSDRSLMDCNPHHLENLFVDSCNPLTEVIIDHYGPVYVMHNDGNTSDNLAEGVVRVEFLPNYIPNGGWSDVSSQYAVDLTQTNSSASAAPNRKLVIKPITNGFDAPGRYRVRPCENQVRCAGVEETNDVVTDDVHWVSSIVSGDEGSSTGDQYSWYQFRLNVNLCQSGMTVFQGDQVNPADMTNWLVEPFEVNADGSTDIHDFIDMADAYQP